MTLAGIEIEVKPVGIVLPPIPPYKEKAISPIEVYPVIITSVITSESGFKKTSSTMPRVNGPEPEKVYNPPYKKI